VSQQQQEDLTNFKASQLPLQLDKEGILFFLVWIAVMSLDGVDKEDVPVLSLKCSLHCTAV
jgi:hypothetical protein